MCHCFKGLAPIASYCGGHMEGRDSLTWAITFGIWLCGLAVLGFLWHTKLFESGWLETAIRYFLMAFAVAYTCSMGLISTWVRRFIDNRCTPDQEFHWASRRWTVEKASELELSPENIRLIVRGSCFSIARAAFTSFFLVNILLFIQEDVGPSWADGVRVVCGFVGFYLLACLLSLYGHIKTRKKSGAN